ncbi:MAG: glycosyltransferase [Microbacteriaceae bacterium]|nr:glycosyltransferase [Microbacteriaceae bacterium]
MRIIIVSRIYRPEPAAASLFLGAVSDNLVARGHDVRVLTVKPPHDLRRQKVGRETVSEFPVLRDKSGYVRGYLQYMSFDIPLFFRLLFAKRADVVLVEPPPTTGVMVRLVCAIRRIPYVYDAADIWSDAVAQVTSNKLVPRVLRAIEKFALRGAKSFVTISQGVVERLAVLAPGKPVKVTGFGANTEDFNYKETATDQVFVYPGTYSEVHGAAILVPAFAQVVTAFPTARLRFIGNGSERETIEMATQKLGISKSVDFIDPVLPHELNEHLTSATASLATLLPDNGYEYAFTSKIYSSMAAGCPIIFAGPGPTGDFIRENSSEAPIGVETEYAADKIAAAMIQFLRKPHSAAERQRLASWTAENHSMQAVASRVADELEKVNSEKTC